MVQSRGLAIGVVLAGLAVALMGDALSSGVFLGVCRLTLAFGVM